MSTQKHIDKICILVTAAALLLTLLFLNGEALGISVLASGDSGSGQFTANDLDGDWDPSGAAEIVLGRRDLRKRERGLCLRRGGPYRLRGQVCDFRRTFRREFGH